ncbi:MAG: SDR family oxidoreductase [Chitinophagales bacterium]
MKNAIITGASTGIGLGIAKRFAQAGFNIAINSRKTEDLERVAAEINALYPDVKIIYKATDVSQKDQVEAFAKMVQSHFDHLDVLVNNAGTFIPGSTLEEPEGALEQLMATNVYSAYHLTRALLPNMIAQKSGHIFNICSVASLAAYTASAAYTISKHALYGFSRTLREELKPHSIRVTQLHPGAVYTRSWEPSGLPPERMMSVEDVAETVYSCYQLSERTVIEDLVMRPMLGDI